MLLNFQGLTNFAAPLAAKLPRFLSDRENFSEYPPAREHGSSHQDNRLSRKEAHKMRYAINRVLATAGMLTFGSLLFAKAPSNRKEEEDRLQNSGKVMQEILNVPDDIPQDLMDKARCVVVMPSVLKAAFVVGGSYGRGTMVCRTGKDFTGPWGAPAMYALEGASVGFQIGGEATDFVFLLMNDRAASSLLHSKVKLGADASAAAGPKGRSAEAGSDAYMRAEILSYSRARGVFAGVSLEGSTLRPDEEGNRKLYGYSAIAARIITEPDSSAPPSAHDLLFALQNSSPQLKH
jgi:SH3 domain-containing YSC84-like protein 1